MFLFEGVALDTIIGLLDNCPVRQVARDELVIAEGDIRNECYLILSGTLRIHLGTPDSEAISRLGAGESVGEIALLDGQSASAYVIADEPSRLLAIHENTFWALVNASHDFSRNLLFVLSRRIRDSNATIYDGIERQQEYRRTAIIDELTGLHNRRWLQDVLSRQIKRSQFSHEPLSLLMIDIDHFKTFNDNFGHLAGDKVIRSVAQTMMRNVRPTDLLARFGGEEFIAALPRTDVAGAGIVAERMCAAVRENDVVDGTGNSLPRVTISIGIAGMRADDFMDSLVERADQALYKAKENGRNRVETAER